MSSPAFPSAIPSNHLNPLSPLLHLSFTPLTEPMPNPLIERGRTADPLMVPVPPPIPVSAKPTDPALIPLPPSPPLTPKDRIPARRPTGWIPSLPRSTSENSALDPNSPAHAALPIASATRFTSARAGRIASDETPHPAFWSGSYKILPADLGRRSVSGTMAHAFRSPAAPPPDVGEDDPEGRDARDGGPEEEEIWENGSVRVRSNTPSLIDEDEDYLRARVAEMTHQEQDEVWMAYVREQLDAIFPDFAQLGGQAISPDVEEGEMVGGGGQSGDTSLTSEGELITPGPGEGGMRIEQVLGGIRRGSADASVGGGRATGMRGELSGLREEIERLRDVVGGLAEGLSHGGVGRALGSVSAAVAAPPPTTTAGERSPADEITMDAAPRNAECSDLQGGEEVKLPTGFIENAPIIAEIVRALDSKHGSMSEKARADEDVFSLENLGRLLEAAGS